METKCYVGNLSYDTTEDELRTLFAQAGTVTSVNLIKDRGTGRSKGFGFIEMENQSEMEKAIQMFNGYNLGERELTVNVARPREERKPGGYNSNQKSRALSLFTRWEPELLSGQPSGNFPGQARL
ncbi:MAG: RNA-binding protein [Anaerolineales bacterium]